MIIKEVYMYLNGMVMAFNEQGEQVPECQGFLFEVADKLKECCDKNTNFYYSLWKSWKEECDFSWWFEKNEKEKK